MDVLSTLVVRFHFNGQFVKIGNRLDYFGGLEAMSYIERDKVSLPEVVGHLKDHCTISEGALLHWLFPGKELDSGLRVLLDDNACIQMSDAIEEGVVADIYVEDPQQDEAANEEYYSEKAKNKAHEEEESSADSDYMHGDSCSSEDDDEAAEIIKKFRDLKKKMKEGQSATLDDVVLKGSTGMLAGFEIIEDGYGTPYVKSSEEEASEVEAHSEGELIRNNDGLPRFKKSPGTPIFSLGMKFRSKQQFKKAIIRYGLAERKCIKFVKDEPTRVRAKCEWKHCPWVILLSTNTRTESWQIVTFNEFHTCPPRRDNRLVTARRIAERYEKFIMANPTWNYGSMKQTVQEEMFADVNIAKLKRAKAMVMQKVLDSTKGQYQRLYDYQDELLRSNPGSTVIVVKEPHVEPPTFQRMFICLDALKKGFIAGCRRVVGLDGCFFKGATNGELLCAIGRDANNQMYPIAWAVVEKETNETWDWFCGLLFKDLGVGDGSDWVFISDQQKVCVLPSSY